MKDGCDDPDMCDQGEKFGVSLEQILPGQQLRADLSRAHVKEVSPVEGGCRYLVVSRACSPGSLCVILLMSRRPDGRVETVPCATGPAPRETRIAPASGDAPVTSRSSVTRHTASARELVELAGG